MTLNVPLFYYPNIFPNAHYHKALHRKDKEYKLVCGRVEKPCVQTSPLIKTRQKIEHNLAYMDYAMIFLSIG